MIEKIIEQLSEEDYLHLTTSFKESKGEKYLHLLKVIRKHNTNTDETQIKKELDLTDSAYYTLRSRLIKKIQEHIFTTRADKRIELISNISSIPHFTFNAPQETAIIMLEYLEKELIALDMPYELIRVYGSLKQLHQYSEKFFHYQKLYNKNVAYTLALDKAEEMLCNFCKELGEYCYSHDSNKQELLLLYIKELKNLTTLYDSQRLAFLRNIACIYYSLSVSDKNEVPVLDQTVEDLLNFIEAIVEEYPEDRQYKYYATIFYMLGFFYYHKLGLQKNSEKYEQLLSGKLCKLLMMSNTFFVGKFFLFRVEKAIETNTFSNNLLLDEELKKIVNKDNSPLYISFCLAEAAGLFIKEKYSACGSVLQQVLNEVVIKNYIFAEIEVKLFLSFVLLIQKEYTQAEAPLRSISRKLADNELSTKYGNAYSFSKLLRIALNNNQKKQEKIQVAYEDFEMRNTVGTPILKYVDIKNNLDKLV